MDWFPPGEVFNFVFELRPKQGQALPVVKRVFPATEAVAKRAAPWPLRPSVPSSEVQIMERHEAHGAPLFPGVPMTKKGRGEGCGGLWQVLEQFKVGQARCVVVAMESRNRTEQAGDRLRRKSDGFSWRLEVVGGVFLRFSGVVPGFFRGFLTVFRRLSLSSQVAMAIRSTYPEMPMVVRAHDEEHVDWLEENLQVKALVPEMIAIRFGNAVMQRLGYPQELDFKAV